MPQLFSYNSSLIHPSVVCMTGIPAAILSNNLFGDDVERIGMLSKGIIEIKAFLIIFDQFNFWEWV